MPQDPFEQSLRDMLKNSETHSYDDFLHKVLKKPIDN